MPQPARDIRSTLRHTRRKHRRLHPIPTAQPSRLRPFFPLEIALVRTLAAYAKMYRFENPPNYTPDTANSLQAIADAD